MKLVVGRGNQRRVYDLPCAEIIKRADEPDRNMFLANIKDMIRNAGVVLASC